MSPEPAYSPLPTADGVSLAGLALRPATEARAAVAMVHGLGEHSGRYRDLHAALLARGFAVGTADLRGFGRSPGPRGHINAWTDYRLDCDAIVSLAASLAPGKPVFLFGHSMGGLIVLDYALQAGWSQPLSGVVASGPALIQGGPRRYVLEAVARILSLIAPRTPTRMKIMPEGISSQPQEVAAYLGDSLIHHTVSLRWGAEILRTMPQTLASAHLFSHPLLLLHGADDPINAPEGSRRFNDACGHPDHTLRLYPGSRHEVHHDIGRADFERDLLRWLDERARRRPDITVPKASA